MLLNLLRFSKNLLSSSSLRFHIKIYHLYIETIQAAPVLAFLKIRCLPHPCKYMHKGEQILSESEIGLLGIGLDFAPIQQKINEPELRRDFQEFCRRIKIKWNFSGFPSLKVESA